MNNENLKDEKKTFMAATPALAIAHSGAPSLQASLKDYCHEIFCTNNVTFFRNPFSPIAQKLNIGGRIVKGAGRQKLLIG